MHTSILYYIKLTDQIAENTFTKKKTNIQGEWLIHSTTPHKEDQLQSKVYATSEYMVCLSWIRYKTQNKLPQLFL